MKHLAISVLVAGLAALTAGCSSTPVSSRIPGYLTSAKGQLLLSQDGQCWRTAEWRPALAIARCDPEVAAREEKKKEEEKKKKAEEKQDEKKDEGVDEQGEHSGTDPNGFVALLTNDDPAGAVPGAAAAAAKAAAAKKNVEMRTELLFAPLVLNSDASFRFGDDHLTQEGRDAVIEIAGTIKARHAQDLKVTVEGYTDRVGSARANADLSRRRAAAVKAALVEEGIPAASIEAVGKGATQPVTQAGDCPATLVKCELIDCLRPDRRVEIKARGKTESGRRSVPVQGRIERPRPQPAAAARREEMRAVCRAG